MPNTASEPGEKGIDIRQALEILSLRSSEPQNGNNPENGNGGCHHNPPKEALEWGQRIYLGGEETANESIEASLEKLEIERAKRRVETEEKLNSMSVKDLVCCVINSQHQRVISYRTFDRGLDGVLKAGNITNYLAVCAEVTASFSVLSDTINAVQITLAEKYGRKDFAAMIARLQKAEKEKLNITAALHLESIRAQAQRQIDEESMVTDTRIASLLEQGVSSLKQKIAATVEEINEVLEELRFSSD